MKYDKFTIISGVAGVKLAAAELLAELMPRTVLKYDWLLLHCVGFLQVLARFIGVNVPIVTPMVSFE